MAAISKHQLQLLAEEKAHDAVLLLRHSRFSNAYYLSGYAIELALKAIIAGSFPAVTIPDKAFVNRIYTHDLELLVGYAQLEIRLAAEKKVDPVFEANWLLVVNWNEDSRYSTWSNREATAIVTAVIDDSGVLPWLKTFW